MKPLKLVYDFGNIFPKISYSFLITVFVVTVVFTIFYYKTYMASGATSWGINKRRYGLFIGVSFVSLLSLTCIITADRLVEGYFYTKPIYDNKQYITIAGKVEHYHPMPPWGHDVEAFDVNGVHFEYSDFGTNFCGYNNAASRGGAIRANLYVRICYYNAGNERNIRNIIIKLETE